MGKISHKSKYNCKHLALWRLYNLLNNGSQKIAFICPGAASRGGTTPQINIYNSPLECKKYKWDHGTLVRGVNIQVSGRKNHEYVSFLLAIYIEVRTTIKRQRSPWPRAFAVEWWMGKFIFGVVVDSPRIRAANICILIVSVRASKALHFALFICRIHFR